MKKFILLAVIFLLTGCYDYHELNDLEIVSSLVLDYKDDKYIVNIEVLDTSESAKTGSHFLSGEGASFDEAINNVLFDSALNPFYSHMKTLIISDTVAEEGIEKFFDYLLRDTQFRKDMYIFVSKDVDKILEFKTEPKESIGELSRMSAVRNHEKNGRYKTCTFRELIYHYLRDNYYTLGSMEIDDDKIVLNDTYLFVNNKIGLKLEEDSVLLSNIIYEKNKSFQIYDDYTYEIHSYKLERKIKKDKIVLNLKGHARLLDSNKSSSLDEKELHRLERDLNEKLEEYFMEIIDYSKKIDHDMYNFNYFYYMYYPKLVEEDTWKEIDYEINSDLVISEKGLLLNSLGGSRDGE